MNNKVIPTEHTPEQGAVGYDILVHNVKRCNVARLGRMLTMGIVGY